MLKIKTDRSADAFVVTVETAGLVLTVTARCGDEKVTIKYERKTEARHV